MVTTEAATPTAVQPSPAVEPAPGASPRTPLWRARLAKYDKYLYGAVGVTLVVFAWWSATATGVLDPKFLTPPQTVLSKLADGLAAGGDLRQQVWPSLRRGLSGFLIGTGLGVVLGILVGSVRVLEKAFDPVLLFFRSLSILALFPVFLLFFGIGEQSKVAIVTWAAFWPVFISTVNAVKGVEKILLNAARTLGAGRAYIFTRVVLPASVPNIFPGVRLAASYAFTALVAAEYLGATEGIGIYIRSSQESYQIAAMYSGIVVLGIIGVTLNLLLAGVEKRLTAWQLGLTNK
ncbi:ABC transporter permease [Mycolicibacterium nivoides]|uniref:ABC transporter permease n=1 Tax=Mycolicibacterium nivoides TaxID=2487344 RepID=UPI0008C21DD0|nr:ABC transporter permease [Mycolicibacterium nivoides]SEQ30389.1 NitT/TauT family transport system permease protein [Mycobacterium sp. 88mf]SFF44046.1 NitT/TauT family transport system permease protein [Mycobacterium sp. 455mf]